MIAHRRRRRFVAAVVGVLAIAFVTPRSVTATTLLAMDIPALEQRAGRIFIGRVEDVQLGFDEQGMPVSWTTFAVDRSLKGVTGAHVTIKQLRSGAQAGALFRIPAMPVYSRGEKVLLFLHPDSALGFTSPVGLGQGTFRIQDDGDDAAVVNDFGNANLDPGMPAARSAARPAAPVLRLDELVTRVRAARGARR